MNVFVAFLPGSNVSLDLPCIPKSSLPDTGYVEPPSNNPRKAPRKSLESIISTGGQLRAKKPATKRGYRSIELLRLLCQQLRFLMGLSLENFFSRCPWPTTAGPAPLRASLDVLSSEEPDLLSLTTDQGTDVCLAAQKSRWLGIRIVHIPDHNHRDNNDGAILNSSGEMCIDILGKIVNGPYGRGAWFKSIKETVSVLLKDEPSCYK